MSSTSPEEAAPERWMDALTMRLKPVKTEVAVLLRWESPGLVLAHPSFSWARNSRMEGAETLSVVCK